MKRTIIVETCIVVEIDDSKIPELLKGYRASIKTGATITDLFFQVAYNEVNGGGFCEGIGEPDKDFTVEITSVECVDED